MTTATKEQVTRKEIERAAVDTDKAVRRYVEALFEVEYAATAALERLHTVIDQGTVTVIPVISGLAAMGAVEHVLGDIVGHEAVEAFKFHGTTTRPDEPLDDITIGEGVRARDFLRGWDETRAIIRIVLDGVAWLENEGS